MVSDWGGAHVRRLHDLLQTHEIALQIRLAVLQQHGDHILEGGLQFIKALPLAVSAGSRLPNQSWLRTSSQGTDASSFGVGAKGGPAPVSSVRS